MLFLSFNARGLEGYIMIHKLYKKYAEAERYIIYFYYYYFIMLTTFF